MNSFFKKCVYVYWSYTSCFVMEGALILANQKAAFAQPMFWRAILKYPEFGLTGASANTTLNIMLV